MARTFADTSGVNKLYRMEPDSPAVRACVLPTDEILISQLTPLEFASAFYGLVRQGVLSLADAQVFITDFQSDLPQYSIVPVDSAVFQEAERLLNAYAVTPDLRPPDAIQMASALIAHASAPLDSFVTTDHILAAVAVAEGMTVKP
jgi:predicted nucleic acid-binding protein